jgi:ankyrin repeat protein
MKARDKEGSNVLHLLCWGNRFDTLQHLLTNHGDALKEQKNEKDFNGNTPLGVACLNGHIDVVKLLISHNADMKARNKEGSNILQLACSEEHWNLFQHFLTNHGAAFSEQIDQRAPFKFTLLEITCSRGETKIAELLLSCGANIYTTFPNTEDFSINLESTGWNASIIELLMKKHQQG